MDNKKKFISLKTKLTISFFTGMLISVISFFILFFLFKLLLDDYFFNSTFVMDQEKKYVDSLQAYVTAGNVAATDFLALRRWTKKNDVTIFSVSRERVLLFDNSYTGNAPLSETDAIQLHKTWKFFCEVIFADGPADVYIHKNYQKNFYLIATAIAAGISAFFWVLFLTFSFSKRIKYVQQLQQEVAVHQTDLENVFTENGNDELTNLAGALNHMREALLKSKRDEMLRKKEQETLVLGMAHDLRTPLTGLMGYLELGKRCQGDQSKMDAYMDKTIGKTNQIRELSDKLFDHFLSNDEKTCVLEAPAATDYALGDFLSELCSQLEVSGFQVDSNGLKWFDIKIRIDSDFMGRIINNLISNIEKYADKNHPVTLSSLLSKDYFGIQLGNRIRESSDEVQGTRIGVQNVEKMMEQMCGRSDIERNQSSFLIILWFPIWLDNLVKNS